MLRGPESADHESGDRRDRAPARRRPSHGAATARATFENVKTRRPSPGNAFVGIGWRRERDNPPFF